MTRPTVLSAGPRFTLVTLVTLAAPRGLLCAWAAALALAGHAAAAAPPAQPAPTCTRELPCSCDKLPAALSKQLFGSIPGGAKIEVKGTFNCPDKTLKITDDAIQVIGDLRVGTVIIEGAAKVRLAGLGVTRLEARRSGAIKLDDITLRGAVAVTIDDAGPVALENVRFSEDASCSAACVTVTGKSPLKIGESSVTVPGEAPFLDVPAGATILVDKSNLRGKGVLIRSGGVAKTGDPMLVRSSRVREFAALVRLASSLDKPPPQKLVVFDHATVERVDRVVDWGGDRPCPTCAEAKNSLFVHTRRADGYYKDSGWDKTDEKMPGGLHAVRVDYGDPMHAYDGTADKTGFYGAPANLGTDLRARADRFASAYVAFFAVPGVVDAAAASGTGQVGKLDVKMSDGDENGRAEPSELIAISLHLNDIDADVPPGLKVKIRATDSYKGSVIATCFNGGFLIDQLRKGQNTVIDRHCRLPASVAVGVDSIDVEVERFSPAFRLQIPTGKLTAAAAAAATSDNKAATPTAGANPGVNILIIR